jgi:GDP-4-dehydro-6-deoxy-D-mannose reductase
MKYLITGITGFAGPHLAKLLLANGHTVHGLIRATSGRETDLLDILTVYELSNIKFNKADLLNYANLEMIIRDEQFDGIFHLAAQSHPGLSFEDPITTFQDNVMGTVNLITCIERESNHTVLHFCSTSEVYGNTCKDDGILREDSAIKPCNPYGVSKAAIDLYMQERMINNKISGFITRAFSHTGPRRFKNFSISSDAFQLAIMEKYTSVSKVLRVGNLETQRVVIDVRDTANAYYLLMAKFVEEKFWMKPEEKIFNICGTDLHKMQYFTDLLIKQSNVKNVSQYIAPELYREIDIQVQIGDTNRLKKLTNWEPVIPITTTLKDLYNYWLQKV